MVLIFLLPILTIAILFLLGFGIALLIIPKKLASYTLWLIPWISLFFLVLSLTILSLLGFSVKESSPYTIMFLLLINLCVFLKKKINLQIQLKEDVFLAVVIGITILLNVSPLIRREKQLTTTSMGNNDAIVYVMSPDYMVEHSIIDNFIDKQDPLKPALTSVSGLIQSSYRFGPPIVTAFFINLFHLKAYQFFTIFQAVIFSLSIPLLYIILKILYKPSFIGLVVSSVLMGFNANLLYIIYHDFFGQVFFWGISLFLMIFFFSYFNTADERSNALTSFDLIIGIMITVLFISYHEGFIFLLAPLCILFLIRFFIKKNLGDYWRSLMKIGLISAFILPFFIVNGIVLDLLQAGNTGGPIGWQVFRNSFLYANPFEIMGFYSIHSFEAMPAVWAILLSFMVIGIFFLGFLNSKNRALLVSTLFVYGAFFIWTGTVDKNFFTYNRIVTYTLPLLIIIFSIGVLEFHKKLPKILGILFMTVLIGLELFSGFKLNKRFLKEFISIDRSLISLRELQNIDIEEPIYTEQALTGLISLWRQMWTEYFFYPDKRIYSPFNINEENKIPQDDNLVLVSKNRIFYSPPKIVLKNIVWENQYYTLGRICQSDDCLLNIRKEFAQIDFGKSTYEDTLIISGWSVPEEDHRWVNNLEAKIRFITTQAYSNLQFEAYTLKEPQEVAVYLDDIFLGKQTLKEKWDVYTFPIGQLSQGAHVATLKFSHLYNPSALGINSDARNLTANFRMIKLK